MSLLILATIPSPWLGFVYLVVFGLGSVGGMCVMSALCGFSLAYVEVRMGIMVGAGGVAFGLVLAVRLLAQGGVF